MVLKVLATRTLQSALPALIDGFERETGAQVGVEYGPPNALLTRIKDGERADLAILSREGIDELGGAGVIDGGLAVDLARSVVGLAVQAGGPRPAIGTAEALKETLLAARSICYSGQGGSGGFFGKLIKRLGIADEVGAKATITPSAQVSGELVARGAVQMAVQQIGELRAVAGLDIVGPLPATLQMPTVIAGAVFSGSAQDGPARELLRMLASAEAAAAYAAAGLEPAARHG